MSASKWKPYPSYNDSDTFAKRIPTHWNELALKRVSSINDDTLPEDTNPMREMCYVDIGSVSYEDGITECEEMVFEKSPSRARRLAKDGDVIVSTVRTYLKAICKIKKTTDTANVTPNNPFRTLESSSATNSASSNSGKAGRSSNLLPAMIVSPVFRISIFVGYALFEIARINTAS